MGSVVGTLNGIEMPKYTVLEQKDGYEVRQYEPQIRAEVVVPYNGMNNLNTPFRLLAGYIFGKNSQRSQPDAAEKIAMTSPVAMTVADGPAQKIAMTSPVAMTVGEQQAGSSSEAPRELKMAFIMPASKYKSVSELPVPKDSSVHLTEVPAHKVAAVTFSGSLSDQTYRDREAQLRAAAARDGITLQSGPASVQYLGYNPPWTLPWCKRNEVIIAAAE